MNNSEITALPVENPKCPLCGAALPTEHAPLSTLPCPACGQTIMVPGKLGQYPVTRLIGRGGMGAVYEGIDEGLNRKVAIKVILHEKAAEDPSFIENFKNEAQAAAQVKSENVVNVYASGNSEGQPFVAMELVQPDALDRMMEQGPVMPARVIKIGYQIAQGLKAANDKGLVHGDVKPENILINEEGTAKLADFGIAALMSTTAANKNEVWGTPYYIAPETLRKQKVDFRADMYSLGATLYHAIAGVPPFEGADAVAVMRARLEGPAIDLKRFAPHCPDSVVKLIMRMLEADPARRFPSYDGLIKEMQKEYTALKSSVGGGKRILMKTAKNKPTLGVKPEGDPSRPIPSVLNPNAPLVEEKDNKKKKKMMIIAGGAGGGVLLLIILLVVLLSGSSEPAPTATPSTEANAAALAAADATNAEAQLTQLGDAISKRVVAAKNDAAEAERILKRLATRAKRAVLPEHEAFLEPSSDEAPTELLKALQKAYTQRDALAAVVPLLEGLHKQCDQAFAADDPTAAVAEVESAIDAYDKSPEATAAKGALATLKRTANTWDKTVDRGRDEMVKEVMRRQEEEKKAREAERKAEAERRAKEAIETEVANVEIAAASVNSDLDKFYPEVAMEALKKRTANLKSAEAKAKAKQAIERIEVVQRLKTWFITETKAGVLAPYGLTAADNETITYRNKAIKWENFVSEQKNQRAIVSVIRGRLVDDLGAKSLSVSKRAELSVSAYYFFSHYFGADLIGKSKALQDMLETLRDKAENLDLTRAELERLVGEAEPAPEAEAEAEAAPAEEATDDTAESETDDTATEE